MIAACLLYLAHLSLRAALALRWIARHPEPGAGDAPEVTFLQPILGGDPRLRDVLATTPRTTSARFVWLVDEDDSVGREAAGAAALEFGDRVEVVVCPPVPEGNNPKTYKLALGLKRVATPLVGVLDDDTTADARLVAAAGATLLGAEPRADLYTGLPVYAPGRGAWERLVEAFVNSSATLTYLTLQPLVGALSINGMFYVARTDDLRAAGGFEPILPYVCDDYALARHLSGAGWRLYQGRRTQRVTTTVDGPRAYARILHRWMVFAGVLLRDVGWRERAVLLLGPGLAPLLLWMVLLFGGLVGAALTLAVRHLVLAALLFRVAHGAARIPPLASVVVELLAPLHALHAAIVPTIRWRTRTLRVDASARFGADPEASA